MRRKHKYSLQGRTRIAQSLSDAANRLNFIVGFPLVLNRLTQSFQTFF